MATLERHREVSSELADSIRELAGMRAANRRTRGHLFRQLNDGSRNITAIRAELDAMTADTDADEIELQGDIDALRVELHHLELSMGHAP